MLTPATRSDYKSIVSLLKDVRFPNLPEDGTAEVVLDGATNFLIKRGDKTIGWIALHSVHGDTCMLDIAVKKEWRGKWLTKHLLKDLGKCIFYDMGMKALYVECFASESTKLAYRLGFQNTILDPKNGVGMVITKEAYESNF